MATPNDPPDPPHANYPPSWETFWREDDDGEPEPWGRDDRGNEFRFYTGSSDRVEGRCNAPLRDYHRRYGEKRYCTRLPAKNFPGYESDYCTTHKSMEALESRWQELFKHGYFAESYVNVAKWLSPTKFLFAIEMFGGLMEMSQYEFEQKEETVALDTSDSALVKEDVVEVEMPVPTECKFQADQLWQGALAEVEMRQMREIVFEQGVSTSHVVASADDDGVITDVIEEGSEHHLHLPISRLTKDIKEHLKNGGVEIGADADESVLTFQQNDYTLDISPNAETDTDDAQPVSEVGEEFTEQLNADDEKTTIEIDE